MKKTLVLLLILSSSGCIQVDRRGHPAVAPTAAPAAASAPALPKNIILLVADGFGFAHLTTAKLLLGDALRMGEMPVTGVVQTRSASSLVTDSAAGASAMATGVKVPNGALGVDATGTRHPTILQRAETLGKATGVVTTAYFWDATPAAFSAHTASRGETDLIVAQMLGSGMEVIAGAGSTSFGVEGRPSFEDLAAGSGYELVRSRERLMGAGDGPVLVVLPKMANDLESPEIPLGDLTRFAIERLSADPDGFFLVVENEGTDSASHDNATADVLSSIRSFDQAIGVALDFARRSGDTLVIVTADHETGAMQLYETEARELDIRWGTRGHTGSAVPLFAFGPAAERFTGLIDNTDVGRLLFGLW